jgi:hypothetical protein
MGVISYQPGIEDEYSAEVIRLARERSPNVNNWIVEQRYLLETDEENLSPEWFRNRCCVKIVNEDFDLLGIRLNMDVDVALDHADLVYGILMLRSKFDPDNMFMLLKRHPELMDAIESCTDEDLLGFIVSWCHANMPTDEGWEMLNTRLYERTSIFESEPKLRELLMELIERIRVNGEPDVTSEADEGQILAMMSFLSQRVKIIREMVDAMWCKCVEGFKRESRQRVIDNLMQGFEKELGSRESLVKFASEFMGVDVKCRESVHEFLKKIRAPYTHKWKHAIEYYFTGDKKASEGQVALMFATMYVDCPDRLHARTWITSELMNHVDQLSSEGVQELLAKYETMHIINLPDMEYTS